MYKRPHSVHELPLGDVDPPDAGRSGSSMAADRALAVLLPFSCP